MTVCNDHDESCKGWTKGGECETNKAFMHRVCPCAAARHEHAGALCSHVAVPAPRPPPHLTSIPRLAPGRSSCGVCQILESVGDKDEL